MITAGLVQEPNVKNVKDEDVVAETSEASVVLFLPIGRDSNLASQILHESGFATEICNDIDAVCQAITRGAGIVLMEEEVLTPPALDCLARTLSQQPPWSDIPLIILTAAGKHAGPSGTGRWTIDRLSNATFLERPLRVATLLQSVKVALNSRRRQYDTREYLQERERAAAEHVTLLQKQRIFLRDVLLSVTEGKLHLCDNERELPERLPLVDEPVALTSRSLKQLRTQVLKAANVHSFQAERAEDFATGVSEAAMNAVVHAGGGRGAVGTSTTDTIQVWIEDQGTGIDVERLPRATLERGFSSAGTLGHGFWLLLKFCDRVYILTGLTGTTVVLELDKEPVLPDWLNGV